MTFPLGRVSSAPTTKFNILVYRLKTCKCTKLNVFIYKIGITAWANLSLIKRFDAHNSFSGKRTKSKQTCIKTKNDLLVYSSEAWNPSTHKLRLLFPAKETTIVFELVLKTSTIFLNYKALNE